MYHNFYQLRENPFNVTADADFFFSSRYHQDAFSCLVYGIEERKGICVITGEIGTGKTTICRKLLKHFDKRTKFALVLNPKFSELQLLQLIVHDLGIKTKQDTKFGLVEALNKFLLKASQSDYNVVVIIDEAQNLTVKQLEKIRLLSNLETEKEKLLQIVLIGQPELYDKLQLPELRQLKQRIAIHYKIKPLEFDDVKPYIEHRLKMATYNPMSHDRVAFTDEAVEAIHTYTKGFPRTINILCDRALLAGFLQEANPINKSIIDSCAKEVLDW